MCKIILHNQENSTCKSIILSMLRLEYEVFHGSVSFQQLLHFFLRHPHSVDILTRHLREGTVVVSVNSSLSCSFNKALCISNSFIVLLQFYPLKPQPIIAIILTHKMTCTQIQSVLTNKINMRNISKRWKFGLTQHFKVFIQYHDGELFLSGMLSHFI